MPVKGGYIRLGVFTLILLAAVVVIFHITQPGGSTASVDGITSAKPKIELLSQNVRAVRVDGGNSGAVFYRVTADYCFRNPGQGCSIRFGLPSNHPVDNAVPDGGWEVSEDGIPVKISPHSPGDSMTLDLPEEPCGWRSRFEEGQIKTIRLEYQIKPSVTKIEGAIEFEGRKLVMTKLHRVFPSTLEKVVLPLGLDAEWVKGTGSMKVEIDFGRYTPESLVVGNPENFSFDGRKLTWRRDSTAYGVVFKAGFMRLADALFRIDDARKVVRTLTDESYAGYEKKLSRKERKWFMRIARNGIFAKYGYVFQGKLMDYFNSLVWYEPNPNYKDEMLTYEELEIIKLILDAEREI